MQPDRPLPSGIAPIDRAAILPEAAKVVRRLVRHGFKAYLVGGCVRDLLLGRPPKDFDIATSARPRQVRRLFRNSRVIGRRFRLVHIRFGPLILEVSTFRAPPAPDEEEGGLYIHRDNVFGKEEEDAFRRDFTINGLFFDLERKRVIDHVGGLDDLARRCLCTIGDPAVRLREDPVRILRAAKFAGRLEFALDDGLRKAAREHREDLRKAAPPRVLEELYRMLSSGGARRSIETLEELRALEVLLPELSPPAPLLLDALDRLEDLTGGGRVAVPQGILLGVLLAPLAWPILREGGPPHLAERAVEERIAPLGQRLVMARRDLTLARQALAAQRRFAAPPHGRSAKRFVRHELFPPALTLRRLLGPCVELEKDPLPEWERLARPSREADPPERRRRRRRRHRRRRRLSNAPGPGTKDGPCPAKPASSSAPAPPTPPRPSPKDSSAGGSRPA